MVGVIVAILVSAAAINGGDTGGTDEFIARNAWLYVAIVAGAYLISRGLAKSGSSIRTRTPRRQQRESSLVPRSGAQADQPDAPSLAPAGGLSLAFLGRCCQQSAIRRDKTMAAQTKTQRQAAAKKAAATRKRNSARQSGGPPRPPLAGREAPPRTPDAPRARPPSRPPGQPHVAPRPRRPALEPSPTKPSAPF